MNDMRLEFLKNWSHILFLFLLIVKSCYKINKIEQCKDVKRKINYVSEFYPSEDIRSTYDIDFERYYKRRISRSDLLMSIIR